MKFRVAGAVAADVAAALGATPVQMPITQVYNALQTGLISLPVGINVFIVKPVAPKVSLGQIFQGVLPFRATMIVALAILIAFPQIVLFLPDTMIN